MIRTFLFDIGNVLVHFSHDRMCEQIGALCGYSGPKMRTALFDSGWHYDFERGLITPDEFHAWFQKAFKTNASQGDLALAASDIFHLNEPIIPVLDELKSRGYRLVILSNTTIFHVEFMRERFPFFDRFDDCVLSYEAGAIKPEAAIFEAALKTIQCDAPDCFYTDDIEKYVEVGRQHGLDAEVFTTVDNLKNQLARRGIALSGAVLM